MLGRSRFRVLPKEVSMPCIFGCQRRRAHSAEIWDDKITNEMVTKGLVEMLSVLSNTPPNHQKFKSQFGFNLFPFESPVAGRGLFLEGKLNAGSLVSIYPGIIKPSKTATTAVRQQQSQRSTTSTIINTKTKVLTYTGIVYQPQDPIFWPSLRNNYIIRRSDGFSIDGKYFGISRKMYQSSASSVRWPVGTTVDISWLDAIYKTRKEPSILRNFRNLCVSNATLIHEPDNDLELFYTLNRNPLNHGNMINHRPTKEQQNVTYFEYFLPPKFPQHLRSFIPNMYLNLENVELCTDVEEGLKMIVLVTTKDVEDEELFSDYNWIGQPTK